MEKIGKRHSEEEKNRENCKNCIKSFISNLDTKKDKLKTFKNPQNEFLTQEDSGVNLFESKKIDDEKGWD